MKWLQELYLDELAEVETQFNRRLEISASSNTLR